MTSQIKFSEHPEYEENAGLWQRYLDLYEGKHSILSVNTSYLWPHELESRNTGGPELRAIRELRSRYMNLIESVVSRWVSFLFREEIAVPDEVKNLYAEDYEDVTGTGVSFQSFWKNHFGVSYVLFGRPRVLVDSYGIKTETVRDAKLQGKRPYLELLSPLEVKDWQISTSPGRKGKYDFLRCEYDIIEPRLSAESAPEVCKYCKVLSVVDSIYTITTYKAEKTNNSIEWKKVDEKPIEGLEEIPVISIEQDSSFIKDASEQQLILYNLQSAESCILNAQAFQKIFVIGVKSENAKLAFGEYVVNFLPEGASVSVVSPGDTNAISSAINATIDRLYKVAFNQINSLSADSKEAPGAESQREAKQDFIALIKSCIEEIENTINTTNEYWAKFKGIKNFSAKVELNKCITLDDITQELAIFNAHKDDIKKVATAYKELLKKRVGDLNLPKQEEIFKEIDAADFSATPDNQSLNGGTKSRLLQQVTGGSNVGTDATYPTA